MDEREPLFLVSIAVSENKNSVRQLRLLFDTFTHLVCGGLAMQSSNVMTKSFQRLLKKLVQIT